jgi:hypothetical protein
MKPPVTPQNPGPIKRFSGSEMCHPDRKGQWPPVRATGDVTRFLMYVMEPDHRKTRAAKRVNPILYCDFGWMLFGSMSPSRSNG